jgi:hypothetical protein
MIQLLLFAILAVIFWPLALIIGLGWFIFLILRVCFGITVFGIKVTAAAGIGTVVAATPLVRKMTWHRRLLQRVNNHQWMYALRPFDAWITKMPPPAR